MTHLPQPWETTLNCSAVGVALTSFFEIIPWPKIAAFLSAVWLLLQIVGYIYNWGKNK